MVTRLNGQSPPFYRIALRELPGIQAGHASLSGKPFPFAIIRSAARPFEPPEEPSMNRRDFLRNSGLASAAVMFPAMAPPLAQAETGTGEAWRVFDVTTRIEILKPAGVTRVWVPTPLLQDTTFQKTLGNKFDA